MNKADIHQACITHVESRTQRLQEEIAQLQDAVNNDTKSSAGDKFETGREMMTLELNKVGMQLAQANKMLQMLSRIRPEQTLGKVAFGSLVKTNEGLYYFSVSLGKIIEGETEFFALSMASPIGAALGERGVGDKVDFMKRTIDIEAIV
ncbi:MAG: 3-oxoacyl-ACP synthase [Rhodothermales bacterium]